MKYIIYIINDVHAYPIIVSDYSSGRRVERSIGTIEARYETGYYSTEHPYKLVERELATKLTRAQANSYIANLRRLGYTQISRENV